MSTAVELGYGSLFQRGDGAVSEAFTTVAENLNVGLPSMSKAVIDATSHDSPNRYREFIGGLKDGGEITIDGHYLPANATQGFTTGLGADFESDDARNYRIVLPASLGTWAFSGIVTRYNPSAPLDGKMGLSVTIKITGKPTFA